MENTNQAPEKDQKDLEANLNEEKSKNPETEEKESQDNLDNNPSDSEVSVEQKADNKMDTDEKSESKDAVPEVEEAMADKISEPEVAETPEKDNAESNENEAQKEADNKTKDEEVVDEEGAKLDEKEAKTEGKETETKEDETETKKEEAETETEETETETEETETETEETENETDNVINYDELNKEQLVELLEETVKAEDVSAIKSKISSIKVAFLKIVKEEKEGLLKAFMEEGGKIEDFQPPVDPLDEKFNSYFNIYRTNKAKFNKDQEELKQKNLELKKKILDDLKELINSEETLKKTYDEFKSLQDTWKQIGMVPQGEVNNLWQSYHFLVEKFFDKVKINKELRDLDLKKNLESKIELCEKAEELLIETSIIKSFKQLQKYHDEWKEVGPVPHDKKDEIWDRFKAATDKINERRKEHYEKLHEEQKDNLEAKTALCEKAEEIKNSENETMKDWQENTNQMNELLNVWKTVGPAPKKYNDEIWERFKGALNAFFEQKKGFYQQLKDQQLNNYNLKVDLCVQAEAIKSSTDWKKTTNDLINLQKEWKTIGPVPKKYSDKVWKRFRAACDEFFNNKSEYYSNIHVHETKNLEDKKELINKIEAFKPGDNKSENLNKIKEFQRQWMEIGHVPIKDKEKVQNDYRKAIDAHFEKLKISTAEVTAMNYKARFNNIKDSSDAKNMMYKERSFLTNKINKLRDDINLWENNIGFLAASKQANILKAEFEKKIDKTKQDLLIMEAKLKALYEAQK